MGTTMYKVDGKRVPGVTTIIGNIGWNRNALMWWAWNEGMEGRNFRETSGRAADSGTIAHKMVEADINGQDWNELPEALLWEVDLIEKASQAFENYLEWKKLFDFQPLHTETHLTSRHFRFGGTPDCIAMINGKTCLFDWKTGKSVYEDHKIQLAAYKILWAENFPENPITGGYHCLRFSKENAAFAHYHWQDLEPAWRAFKLALKLHKMKKEIKDL